MKRIRVLIVTLICSLAFLPVAQADEETELSNHMDKMGSAFRVLRRQASDPAKNEDSIARAKVIRENAEASLLLEPAKKGELPAADQAKFVAAYREQMQEFIVLAKKLEAAFQAGNNAEAGKLLGTMADAQKKGHNDYQKKKKKQS
jgi:soluble cytochrome b562